MNDKESIKQTLSSVYQKYADLGIHSIYLWGSLLTDDYIPGESDIDIVALVNDDHQLPGEEVIKNEVHRLHPQLPKCGFRYLSIGELESGEPISNFLAEVISPKILLDDMVHWECVAGEIYDTSHLTPPTDLELMSLEIDIIKKFNWLKIEDIPEHKIVNYVKTVMRLIYYRQRHRGHDIPFSYSTVIAHADDDEKAIIDILMLSKSTAYAREPLVENKQLLEDFVARNHS
jgi:predicted nucleotidyltransferase